MNKWVGHGLGAAFIGACIAAGYEATQLDDLVWDAPTTGDIKFWQGDNADLILSNLRSGSLVHREDFSERLSVYFAKDSLNIDQVCLITHYQIAGIFSPDPQSKVFNSYKATAEKWVSPARLFDSMDGLQFNEVATSYAQQNCDMTELVETYQDELVTMTSARMMQLMNLTQ